MLRADSALDGLSDGWAESSWLKILYDNDFNAFQSE
jgi:hypothetical protein